MAKVGMQFHLLIGGGMRLFAATLFAGVAASVSLPVTTLGGQPPGYTVTDLGPTSSTGDGAKGINSSGQVAVSLDAQAYVWTNGVYAPSSGVNDGNGPLAINNLGHLTGAGNLRSFIYRNGTSTDLGSIDPNGPDYIFASGLNDDDVVVGTTYISSVNSYRAFVWSNGSIRELTPPSIPGNFSDAVAINDSGMIVGSYLNEAARWDLSGDVTTMNPIAGDVSAAAVALNAAGIAVGTSHASYVFTTAATVWNGITPSPLAPFPQWPDTNALGINDLNQVVGNGGDGNLPADALLWENGGVTDLNTLIPANSGWQLASAAAINDSGQIVGYGYLNGAGHAFLLTLVPEPTSASCVAIAIAVLLSRRRRVDE
jgi:probable HAF family extracellular repeat protein